MPKQRGRRENKISKRGRKETIEAHTNRLLVKRLIVRDRHLIRGDVRFVDRRREFRAVQVAMSKYICFRHSTLGKG